MSDKVEYCIGVNVLGEKQYITHVLTSTNMKRNINNCNKTKVLKVIKRVRDFREKRF